MRQAVDVPHTSGRGVWEVFLIFLRLGLTAFGGPVAHLGYFRQEFVERRVTKEELLAHWEPAWETLFGALATLEDGMFGRNVAIRGVPLRIDEALFRALAHISYHVGQIVLVAKTLQSGHWKYLSIPPGQSQTYNAAPTKEKPDAQAEALKTRR